VAFRAPGQPRSARRPTALARWPRSVIPAVLTIIAVITVICVVAGVWTDFLWFGSVRYTRVWDVTFGTKWALFLIGAVYMMAVVGFNAWLAYRLRPLVPPSGPRQQGLDAYRLLIDPHRRLLLGVLLGLSGLVSGLSAAGSWRTWLLFANRTSFGRKDPQFHLDISFFVFDYPFIRLVLSFLFTAVLLSMVVAAIVHYLYGGLRPQLRGDRATAAARAHMFVLTGTFILLKAGAYWMDRYAIDFSQRGVVRTGASYTDVNAILPAKAVLAVIALICAVLFLAGAARRTALLPAIGLGLLVLSAILLGGVYPAIIQQFVVKPNELAKESRYLTREIANTRAAYGVVGTAVTNYSAVSQQSPAQLARLAAAQPDLRLADPGVISPAFQQLQQIKSYYKFPDVLGFDRYQVPVTTGSSGTGSSGTGAGSTVPRDTVVGVRSMSGPPPGQQNWINTHLVYTHGYGLVAAAAGAAQPNGNPDFTESDIPPGGQLGLFQPRVYFGEQLTSYVIAGGRGQQELDFPNQSSGGQSDSTYHGNGGVPVGSTMGRLLYAVRFRQLNILLSGAINSRSRILYIRDPLARVAKVAPFLSLDNDPYPVVANQQLYWVVDGYTTSDDYPYSERLGLRQATADSYSPGGAVDGAGGQVNYIRNSVKAVVNAYTGQVSLYQWRGGDPVLSTWEKAFPGLIQPASKIPPALSAHLRYPQALFALQRQILTQFHETNAPAFYGGQDFWSVPSDPATGGSNKLSQPPYYLTLTMPGASGPEFSLVTSLTQRGRPNMAAFMAVDSNPASAGYGKIQILQLPQNAAIAGPQQASNAFQSDPQASIELTQLRKGGSQVTFGNLVTVPLGGGLLYTEPVYVASDAGGSAGAYPSLKRVFAEYNGQVGYAPTLQGALAQALAGTASRPSGSQQGSVSKFLQQAQTDYARAQAALRAGHLGVFGADLNKMKAALDQAQKLSAGQLPAGGGAQPSPSATPSSPAGQPGSAAPSPSPSPTRSP
jgi:uncharacterized membrane protein (UPF0182 family)